MSFSRWLRSNSEHYLLIAAQERVARQHGARAPRPPRGLREVVLAAGLRARLPGAALAAAPQDHAGDAGKPPPAVGAAARRRTAQPCHLNSRAHQSN